MDEGPIDWCIYSIEVTFIGDCEIRSIVLRRAAFWGSIVTGTKDVSFYGVKIAFGALTSVVVFGDR